MIDHPENSPTSLVTTFKEEVGYKLVSQQKYSLNNVQRKQDQAGGLAEVLIITSYPPRECGIATYSQDLIRAINNKFSKSLSIKVCALESGETNYAYPGEVKYILKTSIANEYEILARKINQNECIKLVLIQHEFGLFIAQENAFYQFLFELTKPIVIVFHTVLPHPDELLKSKIKNIAAICQSIIVMTNNSAAILTNDYDVFLPKNKSNCARNAPCSPFK